MFEDENIFEFVEPGPLKDNDMSLTLVDTEHGAPSRRWLPTYHFGIIVEGKKAGQINLRIGHTHEIDQFFGHIGYAVEPEFRGNHYAERATRLLLPLAKRHGLKTIWITCNPDNYPSRRTIERLGAEYVETVDLPANLVSDSRQKRRYRIELE